MTSYYKSLEISYDYEAYQLYAEQEMEALGLLEAEEELTDWSKCYDDLHDPDSIDTEDPRF